MTESGGPEAGSEATGSAGKAPPSATPLLGAAWKILAALVAFLVLVLGVGFALPGTWSARREAVVAAPPDSVFPFLDVLERWDRWSPWPDVEIERTGPARGQGATMTWDDPFAGDGRFVLVESDPPRRLGYRVDVEGGSMVTRGRFELAATPGGTRVVWWEEGDFGWNPLMGYAALSMHRVQGAELERGLARLRAVVETGELPDSLRPPTPPGSRDRPGPGGSGPG